VHILLGFGTGSEGLFVFYLAIGFLNFLRRLEKSLFLVNAAALINQNKKKKIKHKVTPP